MVIWYLKGQKFISVINNTWISQPLFDRSLNDGTACLSRRWIFAFTQFQPSFSTKGTIRFFHRVPLKYLLKHAFMQKSLEAQLIFVIGLNPIRISKPQTVFAISYKCCFVVGPGENTLYYYKDQEVQASQPLLT